jgi:hypothetical protein
MDCLDAMTNDFPEFADVLDNTFLSLRWTYWNSARWPTQTRRTSADGVFLSSRMLEECRRASWLFFGMTAPATAIKFADERSRREQTQTVLVTLRRWRSFENQILKMP